MIAGPRLRGGAVGQQKVVRLHPFTLERMHGIHVVWPAGKHIDPRIMAFADWLERETKSAE
jgi:DNA-binding transcriptional LysR family regulator